MDADPPSLPTALTLKKTGVTKSKTDASRIKACPFLRLDGDARHLFEAAHAEVTSVENKVGPAAASLHTTLKKAGSWLRKQF